MGRKTRRSRRERHKRLMRRITLLEEANADPKRHNRKTRKREMIHLAITDIRRDAAFLQAHPGGLAIAKEASRADQA